MYFNDENNKTNIDSEFGDFKKRGFELKINKKVILIIGIILVLGICLLLLPKTLKTEYYLVLNGLEDITIYQNTEFVDPGYMAYDNKDNDYTDEVIVTGLVNPNVAGEYILEYSFNGIIKKRIVTVIGETNQVTYLNLVGSQVIYLKVNEVYQEPGYIVLDSVDANLKDKVSISGEVNTGQAGTYKIVYSVVNSLGVTLTAERTVIVMDTDVSVSYSPTEYTNGEVTVTVNVVSNYFDYVLLPDGTRNINRNFTYMISKNGEYIFKIVEKSGSVNEQKIVINNIDKEKPVGSCIGTYNGNKTLIEVSASDNLEIGSYEYIINGSNKGKKLQNKYEFSGNASSIAVNIWDKAGNSSNIVCSYKNNGSSSSQKPSTGEGSLYSMIVAKQPNVEFPCNLDVSVHSQKLAEKVKQYGTKTRAGVVAAATYLTKDLGYKIGYWWAGKHEKVGLNSEWGCPKKIWDETHTTGQFAYGTVHPYGLDCTGFIKWAFINAGFDKDMIPRADMSYYFGTVLPKTVTFKNAGNEINNIKPGDILTKPGHAVLVIAVSDTQIKIAESVYSGIRELLVDKKTGNSDAGQFEKFVLLEEFYQKHGN